MPHKNLATADIEDPLTLVTLPNKDETLEQQLARESAEAHAKKVSEDIDDQIRQDRVAFKRRQKAMKILVLGQSESGKSTTIKNFQLKFAYDEWVKERKQWKAVVHLNLVRSVTTILEIMAHEISSSGSKLPAGTSLTLLQILKDFHSDDKVPFQSSFTDRHKILQLRLHPLFRIRTDLEKSLGSSAVDNFQSSEHTVAAPFLELEAEFGSTRRPAEFFINSRKGWKSALDRIGPSGVTGRASKKDIEAAAEVLAGCGPDIQELWNDPTVQDLLRHYKVMLEQASGFFLNDVDRVVARDYEPSDDDVLRARLRTMGVQEYYFPFPNNIARDWLLFDVGGSRSSRAAWFPYFDDIDSIIFLAPISCFDQPLAEDRSVNRLADSLILWNSVCSSKLLSDVQMILFISKIDLLEKKLNSGVKFKDFILTYPEKGNDAANVTRYVKYQFKTAMKQASPNKRVFYCFLTSVIDMRAMSSTLGAVYDGIVRSSLKDAELI